LAGEALAERPLGFSRLTLQGLICCAGIGCCAAMSMPQVHIVPYVGDLDIAAARGAEMLALMLGFGVISRLGSGWISDRIGGLRTLLLGSVAQCLVLAAFMLAEELTTFYALSIAFGLAQGGIVPSYAMIVRRYFPAGEAGWRISLALLFTVIGMALGGWMAGALYDLTGSYTISFLNAIGFNLMNMAIAVLLLRRRGRGPGLSPAAA
jgi:MFS family permease